MKTKTYSVLLANGECDFDSRDGIETIDEVIAFAAGRGASYIVYVDHEDGYAPIKAIHDTDANSYLVDPDWSRMRMTPDEFAAYLRKHL